MTVSSAMIFAAGFGTRMRHLTQHLPKPMVPLGGRPMIDHALDLVRTAGIHQIVCNTHYLHEVIEPHLLAQGVQIAQEQPDILDTGGGLRAARHMLGPDPVLTLNPDVAWSGPNPVQELLNAWQPQMQALLLLVPVAYTDRPSGDFRLDNSTLSRKGDYVYTGAQILRTSGLDNIDSRVFSLNVYWDMLMDAGEVHGVVYSGKWRDIGTPEGLAAAEVMLADAV